MGNATKGGQSERKFPTIFKEVSLPLAGFGPLS